MYSIWDAKKFHKHYDDKLRERVIEPLSHQSCFLLATITFNAGHIESARLSVPNSGLSLARPTMEAWLLDVTRGYDFKISCLPFFDIYPVGKHNAGDFTFYNFTFQMNNSAHITVEDYIEITNKHQEYYW